MESRLTEIVERIDNAASQAGRSPKEITLMGVTKTRSIEEIRKLHKLGVQLFGENRVQEIEEKFQEPSMACEVHMIGHLQSNKVQKVVPLVSCIQSMDSLKLIQRVGSYAAQYKKSMGVMVEYNTSGEEQKAGFTSLDECLEGVDAILAEPWLKLQGCMTIGPLGGDESKNRRAFSQLYELRERIYQRDSNLSGLHLSMGMSGDFESAIVEGATLIRVGTYLFGARR